MGNKTFWNKKPKKNRLSKSELKAYREYLTDIGACQICGSSDLDIPHHTGIGIKRSDFLQILLCVGCHRKVHNSLFTWHIVPDTKQMNLIAEENWSSYNEKTS